MVIHYNLSYYFNFINIILVLVSFNIVPYFRSNINNNNNNRFKNSLEQKATSRTLVSLVSFVITNYYHVVPSSHKSTQYTCSNHITFFSLFRLPIMTN